MTEPPLPATSTDAGGSTASQLSRLFRQDDGTIEFGIETFLENTPKRIPQFWRIAFFDALSRAEIPGNSSGRTLSGGDGALEEIDLNASQDDDQTTTRTARHLGETRSATQLRRALDPSRSSWLGGAWDYMTDYMFSSSDGHHGVPCQQGQHCHNINVEKITSSSPRQILAYQRFCSNAERLLSAATKEDHPGAVDFVFREMFGGDSGMLLEIMQFAIREMLVDRDHPGLEDRDHAGEGAEENGRTTSTPAASQQSSEAQMPGLQVVIFPEKDKVKSTTTADARTRMSIPPDPCLPYADLLVPYFFQILLLAGEEDHDTGALTIISSAFRFQSRLFDDSQLAAVRLRTLGILGAGGGPSISLAPTLLYSSSLHGTSFKKLAKSLDDYGQNPVLLVCRCRAGVRTETFSDTTPILFGAFSPSGFREGSGKYIEEGGENCFLFGHAECDNLLTIRPVRERNRARSSTNFTYLNSRNRYAALGLGLGGQAGDMSRFWLSENFQGHLLISDSVFAEGHLLPSSVVRESEDDDHPATSPPPFQWEFPPPLLPPLVAGEQERERTSGTTPGSVPNVLSLEVFGLGGQAASAEMETRKQQQDAARDAGRKVDRRRFVESSFDREFLLGNTFSHAQSDAARAEIEERRREKG
ncbi:unnamed protein product [Amoebophrya sp. A25]|nr:unnamed protein product [Amoebophrya sp. A25]|eukprot:GSA25T00026146001.1